MADEQMNPIDIIELSTRIVSAYVSKNAISASDLPELMTSVHSNLKSLSTEQPELARPDPAVPISKSITINHIICREDGQKQKKLNDDQKKLDDKRDKLAKKYKKKLK